ncbi:Conserved_hypothetical protein [Hexamita inflata]|uniref:Integrase catalytic domain-containing protein n=1 Tax=Hexamita inflata TaxID=28002 RepID=A0ABP1GUY2_9EUKA
MKFINRFDNWQTDLLELRENKYMREKISDTFISIFYNPATHILHLHQLLEKTPDQVLVHLKLLKKYIRENKLEPDILSITSDQGNEYKGSFQEYLFQHGVQQRIVLFDDLQLSQINVMCRYIRQRIQKAVQEKYEEIQDANELEDGQLILEQEDITDIINKFIKFHNFEKKTVDFKKPPVEVTREDVQFLNNKKSIQNQDFQEFHNFKIGQLVHVLLKRDKLEKQRVRKWSQGTYKIVYKIGSFYQLIPQPFDYNQYAETFKLNDQNQPFSCPVYFRKCYQIKDATKESKLYYSYELENTNFYTFDKILNITNKDGKKVKLEDLGTASKMQIQITRKGKPTKFYIKPYQIKTQDRAIITPVEEAYFTNQPMPANYIPAFQMI